MIVKKVSSYVIVIYGLVTAVISSINICELILQNYKYSNNAFYTRVILFYSPSTPETSKSEH